MKYVDEFSNPDIAKRIIERIHGLAERLGNPVSLMEVCGTHTMSIARAGVKKLLPEKVNVLSGPGCPVCVCPDSYLSRAISYSKRKDFIVATFGDMIKVPVSGNSLERMKSEGSTILTVYSAIDALKIAQDNPDKNVVFLAVGFETTAPTVAATIKDARRSNAENFCVLTGHKLIPPALSALVNDPDLRVDGFICPGHVSTIIGRELYDFIARDYKLPCVIAGFEPLDVLQAIFMLLKQLVDEEPKVEIQYSRAVKPEGNKKALKLMHEIFEVCESEWRGLGKIADSGLRVREEFSSFDAGVRFPVEAGEVQEYPGCICGEILCGRKSPSDCSLFGTTCTPENPVGPCMVSSEGTCAAHFKYGNSNSTNSII